MFQINTEPALVTCYIGVDIPILTQLKDWGLTFFIQARIETYEASTVVYINRAAAFTSASTIEEAIEEASQVLVILQNRLLPLSIHEALSMFLTELYQIIGEREGMR